MIAAKDRDYLGRPVVLPADAVAGLVQMDNFAGRGQRRRPKQRPMPSGGWT